MSRDVVLEGWGLHTGSPARLVLRRSTGLVAIGDVPLSHARVVDSDRATTIELLGRRVATVEHLFAAFAGLGVREGVRIELDGPELPLLDGAARAFCEALEGLGVAPSSPALEIARDGEVRVGASRYVFRRGDVVDLAVAIEFDHPRLEARATWGGDALDFRERIAPARTFVFAREVEELGRRGLASRATPESVVVLGDLDVLSAGAPFEGDEPARHKLLDLAGDLFLYGGPPRGSVDAFRPGHRATHAALREAFERGIVRLAPVLSCAPDGRADA